jgi:membrane associated rhomboid family serine protease
VFVLPIPRHEEFRTWNRRAPVVWTVVLLNSIVFLLTLLRANSYIALYAFVPAAPTAVTATTSMFMHSGWMHIIGNMFFLIIFGCPVERAIGSVKFGIAYMLAGYAALEVHSAITAAPGMPVVGASGAISGAVGMYLALFPRAQVDLHAYLGYWHLKTWRSTGFVATGVWFVEQLALALLSSAAGVAPGIAFWAHVGGFLCGVALGFLAGHLTIGYP